MVKRSPLAPTSFPAMPYVSGVRIAAGVCGETYTNLRADLLLVELAEGTAVAGVFTTSKTASANIAWGREILEHGKARILVVNAGNANAFNGKAGEESIERIVTHCANLFACDKKEIYPSSTGVIGQPLKDEIILSSLTQLKETLSDNQWEQAATAIGTTDTYPKGAKAAATIDDVPVTICGIAKGSGMIAPDMATMLAYIFTDVAIEPSVLQALISDLTNKTFNAITVDGDTSTSDTLLAFATGKAGNKPITDVNDERLPAFKKALEQVMLDLAHQIIKDGEGATKFITIKVSGAEHNQAARVIGLSIGNSPLVKTAIAGEDANWGRIVMAVGKAGEAANRDKMAVKVGDEVIVKDGQLNPAYQESNVTKHMQGQDIILEVDVGVGNGQATVWTCDLTHDYITINADYRS